MTKLRLTSLTLESVPRFFKLSRNLKEIQERLDDIATEMRNFQFEEGVPYRRLDTLERQQTGPWVDESEVYGRKEDLEMIVDVLLSGDNGISDPSVLTIVGIGGIGKTTLAQLAYNEERVTAHFDLKMWVSVYDNFKVRKVIMDMFDYAGDHKLDVWQLGALQSQLKESLSGKRFLLVLDDVWNEDHDQWDILRSPLRGSLGSKIVVTSRCHKVASLMSTTSAYHLAALPEDVCWTLFKRRAFPKHDEEKYPNLLPLGQQIVNKCKGLPLAAKILGSLMRFTREESEWSHVQGSELWNLDDGENRIMSVLRLSYSHLPSHVKRCFAYCSLFPKNYEIDKEKLIQLWTAEGLIESNHRGRECFYDLVQMSFFQEVCSHESSNVAGYKMHDLIHDLAKSIAGDEFLTLGPFGMSGDPERGHDFKKPNFVLSKTRHALIVCSFRSSLVPETLYGMKKLRSLNLMSPTDDAGEKLPALISGFGHLRVLNLSGCGIERLHRSIGDLIYLRYLDLSNTFIETLPPTIGDLCNLETLNLSGCNNLVMLPNETANLVNLKHLNNKDCNRLSYMPALGRLESLLTLPLIVVNPYHLDPLRGLSSLRLSGELKIKCLGNINEHLKCFPLIGKELHQIQLSWGNDNEDKLDQYSSQQTIRNLPVVDSVSVDLLCSLRPGKHTQSLTIKDFPGSSFPSWMSCFNPIKAAFSELYRLRELVLINCTGCSNFPILGQLPVLEILSIRGMDSVVHIDREFYGGGNRAFSLLKQLAIRDCCNLKTWERVDSMEAFPCLSKVTIINCPSLTTMPLFPSLQHLKLNNCNPAILRSAAELSSLSTIFIDVCPELLYLREGLLQNNASLASLTLSSCPRLRSLPWDLTRLQALKSLTISWCEQLSNLPSGIKHLTSLESFEIIECPNLISLPEQAIGGLSSLRSFSIENCSSLTSLPTGIRHLTSLEYLTIMYCPNLACIPEDVQNLSSLKSLNILSCPGLASLPDGLQHITTMRNLEIRGCQNLMELPKWMGRLSSLRSLAISYCPNIKVFPEGLQHLSALQHLSIRDCPYLEARCQKGSGSQWHLIAHIPYVYVGSPRLQRLDAASTSLR